MPFWDAWLPQYCGRARHGKFVCFCPDHKALTRNKQATLTCAVAASALPAPQKCEWIFLSHPAFTVLFKFQLLSPLFIFEQFNSISLRVAMILPSIASFLQLNLDAKVASIVCWHVYTPKPLRARMKPKHQLCIGLFCIMDSLIFNDAVWWYFLGVSLFGVTVRICRYSPQRNVFLGPEVPQDVPAPAILSGRSAY
jgi:hypothetical protein